MTEIDHTNQNDIIVVDHCDGIQCFTKEIQYAVPMDQIKALKSISSSCTQEISFGCFLAPLYREEVLLGGWLDINGKKIIA